ncbi:MAG: hypothetical protein WB347_15685, partial [Terriglobales bacterium]
FQRVLQGGGLKEEAFSSEPLWMAIVAFAQGEAGQGIAGRDLLAVAARSAEFQTANELLQKGADLRKLVFTPPVLTWPEAGPDLERLSC